MEWLRVEPGASTGIHRHGHSQVVLIDEGHWEIAVNRGDDAISASPAEGSVVSIPAGVWRNLKNCGTSQALALVVCATDQRGWHRMGSRHCDRGRTLRLESRRRGLPGANSAAWKAAEMTRSTIYLRRTTTTKEG